MKFLSLKPSQCFSYLQPRVLPTKVPLIRMIIIASLISCIAVSVTSTPISLDSPLFWPGFQLSTSTEDQDAYQLVWYDDFDEESLNLKKWYPLVDCSGRGNNELQCYTNRTDNIRIRHGVLELAAIPEKYQNRDFTSGRVHAVGQGWTYGFFEARARLPQGKHLWPAIWMVPASGVYGSWPMSGEIDIMEGRGQKSTSMESTIHYGASRSDRSKIGCGIIDFPFDFSDDYHIFGFEWTNTSMSWLLDGIKYYEVSTDRWFITDKGSLIYNHSGAPFDQSFKWILNVAVGGGYFPKETYGDLTWEEALQWKKPVMEVDWVRVFQKIPQPYTPEDIVQVSSTSLPSVETLTVTTEVSTVSTTESVEETSETSESNRESTVSSTSTSVSDVTTTPSTTIASTSTETTSEHSSEPSTTKSSDLEESDVKKDKDKKVKDSSETIDVKNEVVLYDYESSHTNDDPSNTYYYDAL